MLNVEQAKKIKQLVTKMEKKQKELTIAANKYHKLKSQLDKMSKEFNELMSLANTQTA